jgi:hypothetical protein
MRGLVLGCILLCSMPNLLQARDINLTFVSGKTSRVWTYHSWNHATCETASGVVRVLTKPSHGKVSNHVVDSTLKNNHYGQPIKSCPGVRIKAFEVDYTSAPGFHGTDSFILDVTWSTGSHDTDTYTITVR